MEPEVAGYLVLIEYVSSKDRYLVGTLNPNDNVSIQITGFLKKQMFLLIEVCVLGVGCWGKMSHTPL